MTLTSNDTVAVVIPIYKPKLDKYEMISLDRCSNVLRNYPIVFIAPHNLDIASYANIFSNYEVIRFEDKYFKNISGYNYLLLSEFFYRKFNKYRYILIYQPDAIAFSDQLLKFCSLDYDYIGAPWINGMNYYKHVFKGAIRLNRIVPFFNKPIPLYVGNGGFSLRKVESAIRVLQAESRYLDKWMRNEDIFFSLYGMKNPEKFKIAPIDIALQFSFEEYPQECYKMNKNRTPFGCHAWTKYDIGFIEKKFLGKI